MSEEKIYYYRIFDDREKKNYIKSGLDHHRITELLKDYEKIHQEYFNDEFVKFIKKYDPHAEMIEITKIYY